jgi:hypothetical protein
MRRSLLVGAGVCLCLVLGFSQIFRGGGEDSQVEAGEGPSSAAGGGDGAGRSAVKNRNMWRAHPKTPGVGGHMNEDPSVHALHIKKGKTAPSRTADAARQPAGQRGISGVYRENPTPPPDFVPRAWEKSASDKALPPVAKSKFGDDPTHQNGGVRGAGVVHASKHSNESKSVLNEETLACVVPQVDWQKPSPHIGSMKFNKCGRPTLGEALVGGKVRVFCPPESEAVVDTTVKVEPGARQSGVKVNVPDGFVKIQCGGKTDQLAWCPTDPEKLKRAKTTLGDREPPLNIVYLSADSMSRAQFHRKLTNTAAILDATTAGDKEGLKNLEVFHIHGMNCNGE